MYLVSEMSPQMFFLEPAGDLRVIVLSMMGIRKCFSSSLRRSIHEFGKYYVMIYVDQ
jgi:hypothetical protein